MALSEIENERNRSDARALEAKLIHFSNVKPTEEEMKEIRKERDRIVALDPRFKYLNRDILAMLFFHHPPNPDITCVN